MSKKKTSLPRAEFYYDESRGQYRKRKTINGKQYTVFGATKQEARAKMQSIEEQITSGVVVNDRTTFGEYAARWLPLVTSGLKPSGVATYTNALDVWLLPRFMDIPLREIKPLNVDELLCAMTGKSKSLQKKTIFVFRRLMHSAMENGLLTKNPLDDKKAGGEDTKEKVPLTEAQSAALLSAVHGTRAHIFCALGLFAGLRREEILGLQWKDVHMDEQNPWLGVRNVIRFDHGKPILSSTLKSSSANRNIPIPTPLLTALREVHAQMTAGTYPASVFVVPSASGEQCTLSAFRRLWGIIDYRQKESSRGEKDKHVPKMFRCARTLDFDVTPHILRHTYITNLCASGLDIKKIQYLAGHSDPSITLRIYSHVINNRPQDVYEHVNSIFAGRSGTISGTPSESDKNQLQKKA